MIPPGTRSLSRARCSPTRMFSASPSTTQGPAMRKSASLGKARTSVGDLWLATTGSPLGRSALGVCCGGDEPSEQRMRTRRARAQLGMELTPDIPGMRWQLDHLDQGAVRREPAEPQTVLGEQVAIGVRHFIPVTVTLAHFGHTIDLGRE